MNKIVFSVSYYAPHISGLTGSMINLAESLTHNGYQVSVVTTQHDKHLPRRDNINGVLVERIPYLLKISKGFIMPLYIFNTIHILKNNDQLLLALPQFEGLVIALLAKIMRKKISILYICEVIMPPGIITKTIEYLLRSIHFLCLLLADTIVTLTDDFAKNNILLKNKKNITAIYPIIRARTIVAQVQKEFKDKIPHDKKIVIGYLGRIATEKGIEYLLDTIPYLQSKFGETFIIVIAGPTESVGEEKYRQEIAVMLKKYQRFILQLGELKEGDLGAYFSILDIFVLPSINQTEAFGMVQVEAMMQGVPVVVSNLPGVRVPVEKIGMGEIIAIKDSQAIGDAIIKIIANKNKYHINKSVIAAEFSETKIVSAYKKILTVS